MTDSELRASWLAYWRRHPDECPERYRRLALGSPRAPEDFQAVCRGDVTSDHLDRAAAQAQRDTADINAECDLERRIAEYDRRRSLNVLRRAGLR